MDFIYLLLCGSEWEDMIILLSEEDAINGSIKYPNSRVEIFSKNNNFGYTPTYNFYKNGELIQTTN
jgi:hypothetical protein